MNDLEERIAVLARRSEDQEKAKSLPHWSDQKRGAPNSVLRSSLFSAIQGKDRKFISGATLYSQKGVVINFTGEQFNQEDLTLWEALVHLAKEQPLGNVCTFSAYEILTALGLPTGGSQHKQLHKGIIRLTGGVVQIACDGKKFIGTLIESGVQVEISDTYTITLSKQLIRLYGDSSWTAIDYSQRKAIRKKPLAMALHSYYSTHSVPFAVKVETLYRLSGSTNSQMAGFKRQLDTALNDLVGIGFLESFCIESDLVHVVRRKI